MSARKWQALQAAKQVASRWLSRDYVVSVGIGQRLADATYCDEVCIVVKVDWKLSREALRAKRRRPFPPHLEVTIDGKRARVGVDVQETRGQTAGQLHSIVGAPVCCEGQNVGSVSAVVRTASASPGGPAAAKTVLISGHVARKRGRKVSICGMTGTTGEPVRTRRLDHCLVEIVPEPSQCSVLLDGASLSGVREVKTLRPGQTLYFHGMSTGKRTPLILRDLDVAAPFVVERGVVTMLGLVATELGTVGGDSGAMLFDETFRAVGTLLGAFADRSYFIPCDYAFAALGIQLA